MSAGSFWAPSLARGSASVYPLIPQCAGNHWRTTCCTAKLQATKAWPELVMGVSEYKACRESDGCMIITEVFSLVCIMLAALLRRGTALKGKGDMKRAGRDMQAVLDMEPNNKTALVTSHFVLFVFAVPFSILGLILGDLFSPSWQFIPKGEKKLVHVCS